MINFLKNILEREILKAQRLIGQIMQSEAFRLLESFYHNQSLDLLKNGEVVFGYADIQYLVNKDSDKREVIIEKLYKMPEQQVHIVAAHKKFGHADLYFAVDDFILTADKASVTFSYHINSLKPFSNLDFFDKVKIYGASLVVKLFPETVNKTMFNNKELSEGVKSTVLENKITIDFFDAVQQSPLGQKRFLGYEALDFIQILAFNIREKGFGVRFHVEIPPWFKSIALMLVSVIIRRKVYNIPVVGTVAQKTALANKFLPF